MKTTCLKICVTVSKQLVTITKNTEFPTYRSLMSTSHASFPLPEDTYKHSMTISFSDRQTHKDKNSSS